MDSKGKLHFMRQWIRRGEIRRLENSALECACLDVEHRKQPKKGKAFRDICKTYSFQFINSAYKVLREAMEEMEGSPKPRSLKLPRLSTRDLKESIMFKYNSVHWHDYIARESDEREADIYASFKEVQERAKEAYGWE